MIALTPLLMQVAGVVVLVLIGAGFLWWVVHVVIGLHRGRPIYILPDTHPDEHDAEPDDEDAGTGSH